MNWVASTNEEIDEFIGHRVRCAIESDGDGTSVAYLYGILMLVGEIAKRLPETKES